MCVCVCDVWSFARVGQSSEIEETLERIKAHKGVTGVVIANADGVPIRPSKGMDDETTHAYTAELAQLAAKARSVVRDLDPTVCPRRICGGCVCLSVD